MERESYNWDLRKALQIMEKRKDRFRLTGPGKIKCKSREAVTQ
jgi:hypothetical protein